MLLLHSFHVGAIIIITIVTRDQFEIKIIHKYTKYICCIGLCAENGSRIHRTLSIKMLFICATTEPP